MEKDASLLDDFSSATWITLSADLHQAAHVGRSTTRLHDVVRSLVLAYDLWEARVPLESGTSPNGIMRSLVHYQHLFVTF